MAKNTPAIASFTEAEIDALKIETIDTPGYIVHDHETVRITSSQRLRPVAQLGMAADVINVGGCIIISMTPDFAVVMDSDRQRWAVPWIDVALADPVPGL